MEWTGVVRTTMEWTGVVRTTMEQTGVVRTTMEWTGVVRTTMEWTGVVRTTMEWTGVVKNAEEWTGVVKNAEECRKLNFFVVSVCQLVGFQQLADELQVQNTKQNSLGSTQENQDLYQRKPSTFILCFQH